MVVWVRFFWVIVIDELEWDLNLYLWLICVYNTKYIQWYIKIQLRTCAPYEFMIRKSETEELIHFLVLRDALFYLHVTMSLYIHTHTICNIQLFTILNKNFIILPFWCRDNNESREIFFLHHHPLPTIFLEICSSRWHSRLLGGSGVGFNLIFLFWLSSFCRREGN